MNQKKKFDKVSRLEVQYRNAIATIRYCRTNMDTKMLEFDIAHTIREIEKYGFDFFANHYIRDYVLRLEAMARQLKYETQ